VKFAGRRPRNSSRQLPDGPAIAAQSNTDRDDPSAVLEALRTGQFESQHRAVPSPVRAEGVYADDCSLMGPAITLCRSAAPEQ